MWILVVVIEEGASCQVLEFVAGRGNRFSHVEIFPVAVVSSPIDFFLDVFGAHTSAHVLKSAPKKHQSSLPVLEATGITNHEHFSRRNHGETSHVGVATQDFPPAHPHDRGSWAPNSPCLAGEVDPVSGAPDLVAHRPRSSGQGRLKPGHWHCQDKWMDRWK